MVWVVCGVAGVNGVARSLGVIYEIAIVKLIYNSYVTNM